ncbi:MAG: transcription termination factor NusA [Prevotellaceae bacterium]|jgi:N utilization substance protein A|nr:transcription termination factor NusA [Prevotellaceae bacterium]
MAKSNLTSIFAEYKELKKIDRPTMMAVLEDVFRGLLLKLYNLNEKDKDKYKDTFQITINIDRGDFEILHNRIIVADNDFHDAVCEISLTEAQKMDSTYEVGEEVSEEVRMKDFGRRDVLALRQNLSGRISDIEKRKLYERYLSRVGEMVRGDVYQVWKKETVVLDEAGNELILPKSEQIPTDFLRKGDTVRAVIHRVDFRNNQPVITLSRTAPEFLERLFELEVPEIYEGNITIKKIVRIPGERAKVAVESYDERIDPVGACVGKRGMRITNITHELNKENIDVVPYTNNVQLMVQRALQPAKVSTVKVNETTKHIELYLQPDEISMAIGKSGYNIKLVSQLVGYEIDVFREDVEQEEDVTLDEFLDEVDKWVIDELKKIGCDTAKSVLRIAREDLIKRTDLEEEQVDDLLAILSKEFEDE